MRNSMRTSPMAVVLALLPLLAWADTPVDPTQRLAQQYAQEVAELSGSPRAVAPMVRLYQLGDQLDDLNVPITALSQVAAKSSSDPFARTTARHLLLKLERARGRLTKAQDYARQLGFVTDAYVLGGFDNEGKGGCDTDFGPEAKLDLAAHYPVRGREIGWVKVGAAPQDGFVDVGELVRPNTEAVAYAVTFLESPRDQQVTLALGTSGAHRLWVNGEKVSSEDRYNQARPDQVRVAVPLKKGSNRVLLKLCQESGGLGYFLRTENGNASAKLPTEAPALKGKAGRGAKLPTVTDWFVQQAKAHPDDAKLVADEAAVLAFFRAFDERTHQDSVEAERAATLAPGEPLIQLYAAELQDEDHNLRRRHLDAALKAAPENPLVQVSIALFELQREHPENALAILEPLVKREPRFALARLLVARAYQDLGDWTKWSMLTEKLFADAPRVPLVVREAASSSRRLDRPLEELARLRVALALRFDDDGSRRQVLGLLSNLARFDEAVREAELRVKLHPLDLSARLERAELLAANGRLEDARAGFKDATQLSPDAPEAYERLRQGAPRRR